MARQRPRRPFIAPQAAPATTGGRALNRAYNEVEAALVDQLDELALFQEFQQDMLPKLRDLVKKGAKSDEILELGRALAAGRLITIAATEEDSGRALAAIKEVLDRKDGKVTERKEITHTMAKLKDEDLDALVLTALQEADGGQEDGA